MIKANWKWSNRRWQIYLLGISELNGLELENLTQMIIISTTVSENPLEEIE